MSPPTDPPSTTHILPPPFTPSTLTPLTQGAEALVYTTTFLTPSTRAVLKYRPPKPYRHPVLDKRLTKARLLAEARVLVKCRREGVRVPAVLGGDWESGWLVLEEVVGGTVRGVLDGWAEGVEAQKRDASKEGDIEVRGEEKVEGEGEQEERRKEGEEKVWKLMGRVGRAVGRLHEIGVVHGDLTTSNLMVRMPSFGDIKAGNGEEEEEEEGGAERQTRGGRPTPSQMREAADRGEEIPLTSPVPTQSQSTPTEPDILDGEIVLIDFGLATQTIHEEERAVDLYVLERAFAATHPAAEHLFQEVLRAYGESFKGAKVVLRRLEDVRLRGRKRSMLG